MCWECSEFYYFPIPRYQRQHLSRFSLLNPLRFHNSDVTEVPPAWALSWLVSVASSAWILGWSLYPILPVTVPQWILLTILAFSWIPLLSHVLNSPAVLILMLSPRPTISPPLRLPIHFCSLSEVGHESRLLRASLLAFVYWGSTKAKDCSKILICCTFGFGTFISLAQVRK